MSEHLLYLKGCVIHLYQHLAKREASLSAVTSLFLIEIRFDSSVHFCGKAISLRVVFTVVTRKMRRVSIKKNEKSVNQEK